MNHAKERPNLENLRMKGDFKFAERLLCVLNSMLTFVKYKYNEISTRGRNLEAWNWSCWCSEELSV